MLAFPDKKPNAIFEDIASTSILYLVFLWDANYVKFQHVIEIYLFLLILNYFQN